MNFELQIYGYLRTDMDIAESKCSEAIMTAPLENLGCTVSNFTPEFPIQRWNYLHETFLNSDGASSLMHVSSFEPYVSRIDGAPLCKLKATLLFRNQRILQTSEFDWERYV